MALGLPYAVAVLAGVAGTVLVAMPLEYLLYRRLYRASDPLEQVLMTIGITFVIIGVTNWIFGPTLKTITLPSAISGATDIGFRSIPTYRLFVIACGVAVLLLLRCSYRRNGFRRPLARDG